MIEVRPFARHDREQLVRLVNAHIGAAVPGGSIPAAALLTQLEHPVGEEYLIGPWVAEMATLVAIEDNRVVAATHLRRYGDDRQPSDGYRNTGEIVWLLCWPEHHEAGRAVLGRALDLVGGWGVRAVRGDGCLPAPGIYGVPDAWPHVRQLYEQASFDPAGGQVELVFAGSLDTFPTPTEAPLPGLWVRRQLGPLATAFNAILEGQIVGTYEVDDDLSRGGTNLAFTGWADECNHWVREDLRGQGIGTWLVATAAAWLRLGGTTRVLAYGIENDHLGAWVRYYGRYGLVPINRVTRGWELKRDP